MKRPLVGFVLAYSLGICFAHQLKIPLFLAYSLAVILLIFCLLKNKAISSISLSVLIFLLGVLSFANSRILPKCHLYNIISWRNNRICTIKGFIANQPESKYGRWSFVFVAQRLTIGNLDYRCCGRVLVRFKGGNDLIYGQELILRGNLYRPFAYNTGGRRYRDYLAKEGIWLVMNIKTAADIVRLNKNSGFFLKRIALMLKEKIGTIFSRHTSFLTTAVLEAMILGEKRHIPRFLNDAMMKSGTIHILVVSGFNVGIVAFIIVLLLKLARVSRRSRFIVTIPLLIFYCLITGASCPVVRATIMAVVFMAAYLIKREPDIYNSLSASAIGILVFSPQQLFDASFQLSFASVISIAWLYPLMKSSCARIYPKIKFFKFILDSCLVSFSAWLGTMGFIIYYFRVFTPVTVLANIFIVPLAAFITLCGFSLVFIKLIFPVFTPFFAATCEFTVTLLCKLSFLLIKLPYASFSWGLPR